MFISYPSGQTGQRAAVQRKIIDYIRTDLCRVMFSGFYKELSKTSFLMSTRRRVVSK